MVAITGHAGYIPLYRVKRADVAEQRSESGKGETAVPGRDENLITMASEAAKVSVRRSNTRPADLTAVVSASVTDRFAEHGLAAHVAYRLGATGNVRTADIRATNRASTDAVLCGADIVAARGGSVLVVGTDIMPTEPDSDGVKTAGAGAGALVLAEEASSPIAEIIGEGCETTGFVERHRLHGEPHIEGDPSFEGNHASDALTAAREQALDGLARDNVNSGVVAVHNERWAGGVLGEEEKRYSTFDAVGNAGAASFFLDLAHLLEDAPGGQTVLAIAYGAGGADALILSLNDNIPDYGMTVAEQLNAKEYVTYAKHLSYREPINYEGVTTA